MVRLENNCQQQLKLNEEKQNPFWKFQCCKVIIGLLIGGRETIPKYFQNSLPV